MGQPAEKTHLDHLPLAFAELRQAGQRFIERQQFVAAHLAANHPVLQCDQVLPVAALLGIAAVGVVDENAAHGLGGEGEKMGDAKIDWGEVNLLPTELFRPNIADEKLADQLQQFTLDRLLPNSSSHPHYLHARETDAALVHMNLPEEGNHFPGHHLEKFLFYRGVGKFDMPIQVVFDEQEKAQLVNESQHPLSHIVVIDVRGGKKRVGVLKELGANQRVDLPTTKLASDEQIAEHVRFQLTSQGLYEKEAAAMVATWQDSWFTEEGTRVLYAVPEPLTDKVLPLHISPQPKEIVRVLVGRLEIMTPTMQRKVGEEVRKNAQRRRAYYEKMAKDRKELGKAFKMPAPLPFPAALAELNRFAEPALARLVATSDDAEIRHEATALIHELHQRK